MFLKVAEIFYFIVDKIRIIDFWKILNKSFCLVLLNKYMLIELKYILQYFIQMQNNKIKC